MQKKLFFFHTFALVTAMAILLAVNSGVLHVVMGYYQKRAIPASDERSQQVQSVLDGWDENSRDWDTLEERLRAADYDLVVCQDGEIVSTSLDQGQQDFFSRLTENASWPADGTLVVQDSGVVLVGRQMGDYLLVAMPHFGQPDGPGGFAGRRPQAEVMLISVFVSGLAAIGVIWLFSVVFARYQLRQIMRPVNALTAGAKRVEQGDLSTPVAYQGRDEFTSVCAAFDQMQRHLLEEREKNAAYERARTDLVAGISHDLRTPLTSVKGYIKGMRDGVANTPEKQERYLDIAYRKSCDMERLLQRLLYFSRLETGNLPMFPVEDDPEIAMLERDYLEIEGFETQGGQKAENGQVIRVADLEIYPQSWKVYKAGREIKMPNREFELLKFLAEHPNIVFSKDRLFETIWGFDYVGDSATVTVHVGRIRDKIEDDPSKPRIIETVWGAGYRLNAKG